MGHLLIYCLKDKMKSENKTESTFNFQMKIIDYIHQKNNVYIYIYST